MKSNDGARLENGLKKGWEHDEIGRTNLVLNHGDEV